MLENTNPMLANVQTVSAFSRRLLFISFFYVQILVLLFIHMFVFSARPQMLAADYGHIFH